MSKLQTVTLKQIQQAGFPLSLMRDINLHRKTLREKQFDKNEKLLEYLKDYEEVLNDNEIKMIKLRYIKGLTLKQCGQLLGFSKERARQVKTTSLSKLSVHLEHVCENLELSEWLDKLYEKDE